MPKKTKKQADFQQEKAIAPGITINAQPEIIRGVYSNLAIIQHSPNEFIFDFLMKLTAEAQLVARVVLSPQHTKALLKTLKLNLDKYEETFGEILPKEMKREKLKV
jgi:Protein of unknown function (DUF3467)